MAEALEIRPFEESDGDAVITLWHRCNLMVPWNDPATDIRLKLEFQREPFLIGLLGGRLVATVMAGYEGHRDWINYLAVDPSTQRGGLGRDMMTAAEERLRAMGCPKINLQVRAGNTEVISFYESIGYRVEDNVTMGKRL